MGIFAMENPSHLVGALRDVALELPEIEWVSLQVLVDQHRSTGIQKQRCIPRSSTQTGSQRNH